MASWILSNSNRINFRHYRRKLRAVILGKEHCNNWVPIILANMNWRKHLFHNKIFPPLSIDLLQWKVEIFYIFEWKIKRINDAHLFSQPPLLIFTKGANISGGHCTSGFHSTLHTSTKPNMLFNACEMLIQKKDLLRKYAICFEDESLNHSFNRFVQNYCFCLKLVTGLLIQSTSLKHLLLWNSK